MIDQHVKLLQAIFQLDNFPADNVLRNNNFCSYPALTLPFRAEACMNSGSDRIGQLLSEKKSG